MYDMFYSKQLLQWVRERDGDRAQLTVIEPAHEFLVAVAMQCAVEQVLEERAVTHHCYLLCARDVLEGIR